jgi:hypothetical protein
MGETLLARYYEEDQLPGVAEKNRDDEYRHRLNQEYRAAFKAANPKAKQVKLTPEQRAASSYTQVGTRYLLRLETASTGTGLDEILGLTSLRAGERVILFPRYTFDTRIPLDQREPQTPTPKQLLYGPRVQIERFIVMRDEEGHAQEAFVEIEWQSSMGGDWSHGFVYPSGSEDRPLVTDMLYILDPDINDINGYWAHVVTSSLCDAADANNEDANTLYARLLHPEEAQVEWGEQERHGQDLFYKGLERFHTLNPSLIPSFEQSKRDYISGHGHDPVLLVQGPPGTGKSYSTAFAIFARMQGAMSAERAFRVIVSCKTHAATDVLLENVRDVHRLLQRFQHIRPTLFAECFDSRLVEVDLFRIAPKQPVPGVTNLSRERDKEKGAECNADTVMRPSWCVVASTPGQIYQTVKTKWGSTGAKGLLGHYSCDLLVLDESSQMSLPEAAMSALTLKPSGQLLVVGEPMYDFLTQKAAFDSPISTFLDEEIRDLKNYPMLCQSLQAVSAFLKFDWRQPENYRAIFRERIFDFWGNLGTDLDAARDLQAVSAWYTNRSRFKSEIPLEYAYAAWGELPVPKGGDSDPFEPYRNATGDLIVRFQERRLEAIEHIARREFRGNRLPKRLLPWPTRWRNSLRLSAMSPWQGGKRLET